MKHIIFGFVAIALGVWGIVGNWWAFLDLINVVIPVLLVLVGAVALAAGISGQLKRESREETAAPASQPYRGDDDALPSP